MITVIFIIGSSFFTSVTITRTIHTTRMAAVPAKIQQQLKKEPAIVENLEFNGRRRYRTKHGDITKDCSEILAYVSKCCTMRKGHKPVAAVAKDDTGRVPIALDVKFTFNRTPNTPDRCAIISMCYREADVFVFHVSGLDALPRRLIELLLNASVVWCGTQIRRKVRQLSKDYPTERLAERMISNCRELSQFFGRLHDNLEFKHLDTMARWTLAKGLHKYDRCQMLATNWSALVAALPEAQTDFCAIEVYATFKIYVRLCYLERADKHTHNSSVSTWLQDWYTSIFENEKL